MSIFNSSGLYVGDASYDDQIGESEDVPGEDDDVLNDETFGAAEVVDWESEHARLAGLDVNGFEEFGEDFSSLENIQRNGNAVDLMEDRGRNDRVIGKRSQPNDESDFGVDVEKDLQRLVLEVEQDDMIESAWLSADPAIKMLSKKIPRNQTSESSTEAADSMNTSSNSKLLASIDDVDKIWAPSQPRAGSSPVGLPPQTLSGAKTVSELENELAEEVQAQQLHQMKQQQFLSPHARPHGALIDGSLSPTSQQQMLLQHQQQLAAAAAMFQQQQQRQSPHPQSPRPVLPPFHPYLGRSANLSPAAANLISPVAPAPPLGLHNVPQMLLHSSASSPLGMMPSTPQHLELLQHVHLMMQQRQQQQQQQQQEQAALLRSHFENVNEQFQTQQRLQQMQARHQGDRRWHSGQESAGNEHHRQRRYSDHIGPERFGNSDDPYAGLMTRSEKEWLISIHHRQLEVENPFVEDYYYTQFMLKKDQVARSNAISTGQLPLPPDPILLLRAPVEVPDEFDDSLTPAPSTPYAPSQFANTLGKLTTASVHNPRQVIDARVHKDSLDCDDSGIGMGNGADEAVKKTSSGAAAAAVSQERYRRTLLTIENCYSLLLKIQEYDISIAKILVPNAPSRHVLITDRHRLKQQLVDTVLASESSVVSLFRVRKGALLFARMLNKLESKYVDMCIRSFFKCFPRIRQSTKSLEVLEDVGLEFLKIVCASLNTQEGTSVFRNLLYYIWMNTNHAEILSHRLGLTLVLAILNQFASSVNDQEELKQLQSHLEQMAMNLFVLPLNKLARPYSSYFGLLNYMKGNLPEAMRNNFSDKLAYCLTSGKDEDQVLQERIPSEEQSDIRHTVREVNPADGLTSSLLTSASSA